MPEPRKRTLIRVTVGLLLTAAVAAALQAGAAPVAEAQGWWPWSGGGSGPPPPAPSAPPVPREPVYRDPGARPPSSGPGSGAPFAQGQKAPICAQLEQRLVMERQRGNLPREALPRIEADIRQADRQHRQALQQLEDRQCYDYFLFSKTLRRTKDCIDLSGQAEATKRRVAELDAQRQQILGTRDRSFEDDIVRDLARNNCGASYSQEAARRGPSNPFSSLWQDEELGPGGRGPDFRSLDVATYRTICVRLCDGYFFPVSFSTLQTHFDRDAEACQSRCAAPAELYFYQNPGGTVEQAVSVRNKAPYTSLKTAFRYRKEFVQGCSCKQAEYTPSPNDRGDRRADTPSPPAAPAAGRQAQR